MSFVISRYYLRADENIDRKDVFVVTHLIHSRVPFQIFRINLIIRDLQELPVLQFKDSPRTGFTRCSEGWKFAVMQDPRNIEDVTKFRIPILHVLPCQFSTPEVWRYRVTGLVSICSTNAGCFLIDSALVPVIRLHNLLQTPRADASNTVTFSEFNSNETAGLLFFIDSLKLDESHQRGNFKLS